MEEILLQLYQALLKLPAVVLLLCVLFLAIQFYYNLFSTAELPQSHNTMELRDAKEVQQEIWEETTKETKARLKAQNKGEFDSVGGVVV